MSGSGAGETLWAVPTSDVTFGLALLGAVTGTASTAAQIYSTARDRPRIEVTFGWTTRLNGRPTVYIDATNVGHRATTVRQVGFFARPREIEIIRQGETVPWAKASADVTFADGPMFLEAGESKRIELVPNIDVWGIHADFPMRVFAVDMRGRRIWGDAARVIRHLVGERPPFGADDPADFQALFEPAQPELRPWPVEPRWKLWKRRELRDPSAWRES
jgi:hypothetical protein